MSGETLQGGVREIEEETGLNVVFEDLIFLEKRECNKKIKENYIVREFQYFYYLNIHHFALTDFKKYDKEEIVTFVELKINDALKLLQQKKKKIKGKRLLNGETIDMVVTLDDFNPDFLEEGLYQTLLLKLKSKRVSTKKKLRQLHHKKGKVVGKVINQKDFIRNGICFSVLLTKQEHYIVGLTIDDIPMLLEKHFQNSTGGMKYFECLCHYVENTSSHEIITDCYEEKRK